MQGSLISLKEGIYSWTSPEDKENAVTRHSLLEVLSHLSTKDIRQIKCTSKLFYQLITSDKPFVKQLMHRNYEVLTLASRGLKIDLELQALAFEKSGVEVDPERPLGKLSTLSQIGFFNISNQDMDVVMDVFNDYYGNSNVIPVTPDEAMANSLKITIDRPSYY